MMMAVVMTGRLSGILRRVLLNDCEVLLSRLQVSRLQILSQFCKRLHHGVGTVRSVGSVVLQYRRKILRQRGEIRLRLRQIACLEILSQLLKFTSYLQKGILLRLLILCPAQSRKNAASNTDHGHGSPHRSVSMNSGTRCHNAQIVYRPPAKNFTVRTGSFAE